MLCKTSGADVRSVRLLLHMRPNKGSGEDQSALVAARYQGHRVVTVTEIPWKGCTFDQVKEGPPK